MNHSESNTESQDTVNNGDTDVSSLLSFVAKGSQVKAETLIQKNPGLLLKTGDTMDYSGRAFNNVTAFQLALWYKDAYMCKMILHNVPGDSTGEAIRVALIEQYKMLEEKGLTYTLDDTSHCDHCYDFTPLIDALKLYSERYDDWVAAGDWPEVEEHWCEEVGSLQREVPAHVAQEYCNPTRATDSHQRILFDQEQLHRSFHLYNYRANEEMVWFPLKSDDMKGLGHDIGILWEAGGGGRWAKRLSNGQDPGAADLAAMEALDRVRTEDIRQLIETLMASVKASD